MAFGTTSLLFDDNLSCSSCLLPTTRVGNVFTGVCYSVHNRPHGYSFTAHPCYGTTNMHPSGMLSCYCLQQSWGKVIFSQASVILSTGGHGFGRYAWLQGACMVAGWACMVVGGLCGCRGGVHSCGGHAWLWGACVVVGSMHGVGGACVVAGGIRRDTVNEWAVRILLECILVSDIILRHEPAREETSRFLIWKRFLPLDTSYTHSNICTLDKLLLFTLQFSR